MTTPADGDIEVSDLSIAEAVISVDQGPHLAQTGMEVQVPVYLEMPSLKTARVKV